MSFGNLVCEREITYYLFPKPMTAYRAKKRHRLRAPSQFTGRKLILQKIYCGKIFLNVATVLTLLNINILKIITISIALPVQYKPIIALFLRFCKSKTEDYVYYEN